MQSTGWRASLGCQTGLKRCRLSSISLRSAVPNTSVDCRMKKISANAIMLAGLGGTIEMQDSALAQVRRANRSISRLYNLVLSSCGLTATQYVLLQSIAATREISQLQLSEKLSAASTTLSRRLSCLRKKA